MKNILLSAEPNYPTPDFSAPDLYKAALKLRENLIKLQSDFGAALVEMQANRLMGFLDRAQGHLVRAVERLKSELELSFKDSPQELISLLRESRAALSQQLLNELNGLIADGQAAASQKAFSDFFKILEILCEEVRETIVVTQEPERFAPAAYDSFYIRSGKRIKRWIVSARSRLGLGEGLKRRIHFKKLVCYHLLGRLPPEMLRTANLVGMQVALVLQTSRDIYAQIEASYEAALALLEGERSPSQAPLLNELLEKLRQLSQSSFAEARRVLERSAEEINRLLALLLSQACEAVIRDLGSAGTFELPSRRYRYAKVQKESEAARAEIITAFDIWSKYHAGLAGLYAQRIEIVRLTDETSRAVNETVESVLESVEAKLVAGLLAARERCERSLQYLASRFDSPQPVLSLRQELAREQEQLLSYLRQEGRQSLRSLRRSRELTALPQLTLQRFSSLIDGLPEQYFILQQEFSPWLENDRCLPPEVKLRAIPIRELTGAYLEREVTESLAVVKRQIEGQIDEAIRAVTEATQLINFRLRTALEEMELLSRESPSLAVARPKEVVNEGLQKAIFRIEETLHQLKQWKEQIHGQIIARVNNRMREIEALITEGGAFDPQRQPKKKQSLLRRLQLSLRMSRRRLINRYQALAARFKPLGQEVVKDLKSTLGLQHFTTSEILAIYDQAKLDEEKIDSLPPIYQKLFKIAPLETSDFLVARERELQVGEMARESWRQGMRCCLAVIGELGSGKTSLINALINDLLGDYPVYKKSFLRIVKGEEELLRELAETLGLAQVKSFDELQLRLSETEQKRVVVLEDAHQLYLRTLGGFESLKRLLLLIASTSHQVFWVISMRKYSWLYLNRVLNIADNFTFVIDTERFSAEQLKQVIYTRHKVSGLELHFLPAPAMMQKKAYRKASEEKRQQLLENEYFEELGKASEGNILTALIYWLKSIHAVQTNKLMINPLPRMRFDFLLDLQIDKLLTLSMIMQHGNLSAQEHAQVFNSDLKSSLATLTYLTNINLLIRQLADDGEERFAINKMIYLPLARELRARNILSQ